jgi:hypothetical protein
MFLLGVPLLVAACSEPDRDDEHPDVVEPDSLFASTIPVDMDLRLREGFDYTTYYGVIESSRSLSRLWSQLVNVQRCGLRIVVWGQALWIRSSCLPRAVVTPWSR